MVLKRSLWAENRLIGKHYRPRSDNAEYKKNTEIPREQSYFCGELRKKYLSGYICLSWG